MFCLVAALPRQGRALSAIRAEQRFFQQVMLGIALLEGRPFYLGVRDVCTLSFASLTPCLLGRIGERAQYLCHQGLLVAGRAMLSAWYRATRLSLLLC